MQREEGHREQRQEGLVDPAAVADRLHRRAVEPRQEEVRQHRDQHRTRPDALVRERAQDRVVGREVPRRRDRIGRRAADWPAEVRPSRGTDRRRSARRTPRAQNSVRKHADAEQILDGVVRMERDAVERLAVRIRFALISTPSGLFEPTSCSATRCSTTSSSSSSGIATTCSAKKRFSVASAMP